MQTLTMTESCQGSGFRVEVPGLGFGAYGSGVRVKGAGIYKGLKVSGLRARVYS